MDPTVGALVLERTPGLFSVYGEIDAATAPRLAELEDVHGPLQLDLAGVTFMDSTGISAIVRLYRRCPHDGCSFQIVDCSPQVQRLLQIVELYDYFVTDSASSRPPASEEESGAAPPPLDMSADAGVADAAAG